MKTKFLWIIIFLTVTGCAGRKVWVNPESDSRQSQRDSSECKYDSIKHGHVAMWGETGVGAGLEEAMRKDEIFTACMESKGYKLVRQK